MTIVHTQKDGYYDLSFVMEISGGDENFIREMVGHFTLNTPQVLKRIELYGREENWDELAAETHKFIPGLGFLGVSILEAPMKKMEQMLEKKEYTLELEQVITKVITLGESVMEIFRTDFNI